MKPFEINSNSQSDKITMTSLDSDPKPIPFRQIRALYDEDTITVYQAYSAEIAIAAVAEQRLNASPAFQTGTRMTWIKPSFCWAMYRSGYATKDERQTHILAIKMTQGNFRKVLREAVVCDEGPLSSEQKRARVRVQWDPERSARLGMLKHRSIQIGLGKGIVKEWVEGMIESIEDVTDTATSLKRAVDDPDKDDWKMEDCVKAGLVPVEKEYDLSDELRRILCMDETESKSRRDKNKSKQQ